MMKKKRMFRDTVIFGAIAGRRAFEFHFMSSFVPGKKGSKEVGVLSQSTVSSHDI